MEDAGDGPIMPNDMPVPIKNGEVLPTENTEVNSETELVSDLKSVKINGDTKGEESDGVDSSDCDNLVIDERPQNNRKRKLADTAKGGFKGFKRLKSDNNEYEPPTNPYFNESLFELSALHHNKELHSIDKNHTSEKSCVNENQDVQGSQDPPTSSVVTIVPTKKGVGKKNKKNGSPKLREYAQYLGLQPTVQFKCSKCAQTGFQSLALLNEHHRNCNAIGPITQPTSTTSSSSPSTNFRVTRKVFLCSACGTYYENWNLFLHMREVHKRFICLYCLGMFSFPEKLSLHLMSKHNCVPNNLVTEENFFQVYKEPCFLMCCDCDKVFSERDNFFNHNCQAKPNRISNSENKSKNVTNPNRHLNNQKQSVVSKTNNKQLKNSKTFVEHVTADTPETEPSKDKGKVVDESISGDHTERLEEHEHEQEDKMETQENFLCQQEENKDNSESESQPNLLESSIAQSPKNSIVDELNNEISNSINNDDNSSNNNNSSNNDNSSKLDDVMETNKSEVGNDESEVDVSNTDRNLDLDECDHIESNETEYKDDIEVEEGNESPAKPQLDSSLETTTTDEPETNQDTYIDDIDEPVDSPESHHEQEDEEEEEEEDTRKVPKVTLKLPKSITATNYIEHEDSDDSDKLTMEFDSVEPENQNFNSCANDEKENKDSNNITEGGVTMVVAGVDIPIIELELEQPLDKFDIQVLLQKCLKATVPTCVYCNHARKIAVNGRQLGLHAIAEHRFSAIVNSITAEELIPESFVMRIRESLPELRDVFFNLESTSNEEGITFSHVFECFQCRYSTTVHKELYLHNRKMHAKTILLCIMCKSNFYSYSELICHLCPGLYELNNDVSFRCCMCVSDDLPSAFRLMVHLRKRHHACDVCLELCHNQSRLSNHVWKHKLHHLCYRCGIAYRNKPDITKHLFWKHGTESVLCKRCLQKKWPHVYHFCIPPSTFSCEECNLNFTKAVSLKVHKRLHTDERPHTCTFENCFEKFISKKLLLKHEFKHREPPEESLDKNRESDNGENVNVEASNSTNVNNEEEKLDDVVEDESSRDSADKPKPKPKVDVYDLPELNLSESDSSDSEDEAPPKDEKKSEEVQSQDDKMPILTAVDFMEGSNLNSDGIIKSTDGVQENALEQPAPILENIWDDFKNYQASKEKMENINQTGTESTSEPDGALVEPSTSATQESISSVENSKYLANVVMMDHDYSMLSQEYRTEQSEPQVIERTQSTDHDYCSANINKEDSEEQPSSINYPKPRSPQAPPKGKRGSRASSSSDSSDSDSSSCTCGSNCSCSSSSGSSSSSSASSDSDSSSSEGRRKQQARRERRKLRAKNKNSSTNNKDSEHSPIDVVATDQQPTVQVEQLIQESDLDTTETETDEDFYDKQPQKIANKLIAEKRKELLLLAGIGPLINGSVLESSRPSTPSLPETEELKPKKKSKNKKKKKKSRKQEVKPLPPINIPSTSYQYQYQPSAVSPLMISLPKNSPLTTPAPSRASASPLSNAPGLTTEDLMTLNTNTEASNLSDSHLRASKRRRIPNKFYGYSSDEERERHQPPVLKWRKADLPSPARPAPSSPLFVPPITIKAIPPVSVAAEEPVRPTIPEMRIQQQHHQHPQPSLMPQNFQPPHHTQRQEPESSTESNGSSSDEEPPQLPPQPPPFVNNKPNQPPLYCYCRCPYDEVSEMIGCDASDCMIEWFHFECVGIMVPPKGQWFCPDCRKKKQQRKELAQT